MAPAWVLAKSQKMTYTDSKDLLISIFNDLPSGVAHVKMAAMDSGAARYCYGFQIGNCRYGPRCIFKHEKDPDDKAVPGKQEALEKQK